MYLKHGYGTIYFKGGDKYRGSFKDDNFNGYGVYTFIKGMIVRGDWKDALCLECDTLYFSKDNNVNSGCISGDCDNGYGIYLFPSGAKYEGQWKNSFENGKGIWYEINGDRYEGEFKDRLREGFGIYFYVNGDTYQGQFENGNYHGEGIFTDKEKNMTMRAVWDEHVLIKFIEIIQNGENIDPNIFNEYLNKNFFFGKGTKHYDSSSALKTYTGDFIRGVRNGKGVAVYNNGDTYNGEWKDGAMRGYGTYIWPNGVTYVGEWKNNLLNGIGVFTIPGVRIDSGYFENDKLSGEAVITYFEGGGYKGKVKEDKKNGDGTLIYSNGDSQSGEWLDDEFIKGTTIWTWDENGVQVQGEYVGEWDDGKKHGFGTLIQPNGDIFEGYFEDDAANGMGKMTYINGIAKEGFWEKGVLNGDGVIIFPNGRKYEGYIKDNQPNGYGRLGNNSIVYEGVFKLDEAPMEISSSNTLSELILNTIPLYSPFENGDLFVFRNDTQQYIPGKNSFYNVMDALDAIEPYYHNNELFTGTLFMLYEDGNLASKISVRSGKFDGEFKVWNKKGEIVWIILNDNGLRIEEKRYFDSSNLIMIGLMDVPTTKNPQLEIVVKNNVVSISCYDANGISKLCPEVFEY